MPIHIGEIESVVTLEPESTERAEAKPDWQETAEVRSTMGRIGVDYARTAADGFDD